MIAMKVADEDPADALQMNLVLPDLELGPFSAVN